jgi:hypothetical protein
MEGSLVNYQNLQPPEVYDKIMSFARKIKKYNGEFVLLWHNSSFSHFWGPYAWIYEEVIKEILRQ